jgi:DNA-binding transcriptional ArsR family regulator
MNMFTASVALGALGHQVRLRVFRLLVTAGPEGLTVGEIGRHVGLAPSTLAHHLKSLCDAGLVLQERKGREVMNRANYDLMDGLVSFLTEACCSGVATAGPVLEAAD